MYNLRQDLSAAIALSALGVQSNTPQLRSQQVSLNVLNVQNCIDLNKRLDFERSRLLASAAVAVGAGSRKQGRTMMRSRQVHDSKAPRRNFAQKLFDILQSGFHSDIIRWLSGGKAFIILDKKRFASEILPTYFKESQFPSFTRKLSRWKFSRVASGPYMGAYFHKNFRSDSPSLCKLMCCNGSKKNLLLSLKNKNAETEGKQEEESVGKEVPEQEAMEVDDGTMGVLKTEIVKDLVAQSVVDDSSKKEGKSRLNEEQLHNFVPGKSSSPVDMSNHDTSNKLPSMDSPMSDTTRNIFLIKKQLLEIRLRKAQVEEKKQILLMQAAEERRLREIENLRKAVNLSIQQAESKIMAAAAIALDRIKHRNQRHLQQRPPSASCLQHNMSTFMSGTSQQQGDGFKQTIHQSQLRYDGFRLKKPTRSTQAYAA